jgi:hypothetical protein
VIPEPVPPPAPPMAAPPAPAPVMPSEPLPAPPAEAPLTLETKEEHAAALDPEASAPAAASAAVPDQASTLPPELHPLEPAAVPPVRHPLDHEPDLGPPTMPPVAPPAPPLTPAPAAPPPALAPPVRHPLDHEPDLGPPTMPPVAPPLTPAPAAPPPALAPPVRHPLDHEPDLGPPTMPPAAPPPPPAPLTLETQAERAAFLAPEAASAAPPVAPSAPPPAPRHVPPPAPFTLETREQRAASLEPEATSPAEPVVARPALAARPTPVDVVENPLLPSPHAWRRPRRPEWSEVPSEEVPARARLARYWPWAAAIAALFTLGWLVGALPGGHGRDDTGGLARLRTRFGFAPPTFQLAVDSRPQGAWIAVDGRDLGRRTPATLDLAPGPHEVALTVAQLGSARFHVKGTRRERVTLDAELWGTLAVTSSEASAAVKVTLDDQPRGLAPLVLDGLAPGVHRVQFWSPGAGSWGQIVEVRVRDTTRVVARPIASPATGELEVRATLTQAGETQTIDGATVWLDGRMRGTTPLRLELPRGPHSVRVNYQGQDSPVQVVDLPGGNERFATFDLGFEPDRPRLSATAPGPVDAHHPGEVTALAERMRASEVKEMWLHVSGPEGTWRRFPMTVTASPDGAAGQVDFPLDQLDAKGRARFYVSVMSRSGDEYFSEIEAVSGTTGEMPAKGP